MKKILFALLTALLLPVVAQAQEKTDDAIIFIMKDGSRCNLCKGTGRKVRESWSGDKTSTKWCNECNKSVGMGHSHTNCDLCGGDGWCD